MTRLPPNPSSAAGPYATRRALLRGLAGAGLIVPTGLLGGPVPRLARAQSQGSVLAASQRPFVELIADYPFWVASRQGYFGELRALLDLAEDLGTGPASRVAAGLIDLAHGTSSSLVEAIVAGDELVSIFQLGGADPFDLAVQRGNPVGIDTAADLSGKVISIAEKPWSRIVDLLVIQAGGDPDTVRFDVGGPGWMTTLHDGRADAALAWAGLRARSRAGGVDVDYLLGAGWSSFPGNAFMVRRADLELPALEEAYAAYLRGWAMGLEFGHHNPRAAVQIAMEAEEAGASLTTVLPDPSVAVQAMWELARGYRGDWPDRGGWGSHRPMSWTSLLKAASSIGLLGEATVTAELLTTDAFIAGANDFDRDVVAAEAKAFELTPAFAAVDQPLGVGAEGAYPT